MNKVKCQFFILCFVVISVGTSFADEGNLLNKSDNNKTSFLEGPAINSWAKFISSGDIIMPQPRPNNSEHQEIKGQEDKALGTLSEEGILEAKQELELEPEPDVTMAIRADTIEPVFIDGDIDESIELPEYPEDAIKMIGENKTYTVREEDTLLDIARHFDLGFIETFVANPNIDTWIPEIGTEITLPHFKIVPRTKAQEGIVVNLAQMRIYYFKDKDSEPLTFPIGIGREGLQTPVGQTRIAWKRENPTWSPTKRMLEEKEWLPKVVPSGVNNPLGTHALYLGWSTFLMHGTNKPWAIGRRVSSGCMRMYPKDIKQLFDMVEWNTPVTIVNQPILVAEKDGDLYLEANPTVTQGNDIEMKAMFKPKPLNDEVKNVISKAFGDLAKEVKWDKVAKIMLERRGYPIKIN